jgi:type I restriction enzyme S subunit
MHDLFTRGVLPNGQLRPPRSEAPELYRETGIGWIPREWKISTLNDLLAPLPNNIRSGPFGSALLKHELVEDGIPFLGIDNIHVERFDSQFRRFVSKRKFLELAKYKVRPRDVVITIMGTVGRCCVIPGDLDVALSSKHLWTMTFNIERAIPELICWQLNYSSWAQAWFRRAMQGGIMDAIQSTTLKTLQLPVPSIDEQALIYARYAKISARICRDGTRLEKLKKQKLGLMQDLLTGKVPVHVDEPATEITA